MHARSVYDALPALPDVCAAYSPITQSCNQRRPAASERTMYCYGTGPMQPRRTQLHRSDAHLGGAAAVRGKAIILRHNFPDAWRVW
jgi:hypothetical protein